MSDALTILNFAIVPTSAPQRRRERPLHPLDLRATLGKNCPVNPRRIARAFAHLLMAFLALLLLLLIAGRGRSAPAPPSQAAAPAPLTVSFSPPSGLYRRTVTVEMRASDPAADIYFTTDGSVPSPDQGTLYTQPLTLAPRPEQVVVFRALAVSPTGETSPIAPATYALGMETAVPIVSLIVAPDDLWEAEAGIFANPLRTGSAWERPADMAFLEADGAGGFLAPLGVRVHGGRSRRDEKKSLRFYFRDQYGLAAVEYPLFPASQQRLFKRLVLHNGGQDYPAVSVNATLLRNQLTGDLAREVGGLATQTRPVLVYLNGELWGIYNLRERIDDRFLAEQLGIMDPDLLVGFEYDLEASYGDTEHWQNLQRFVAENDLRTAENYLFVQTQINLDNFIDYNLFQVITANADWPHSNQLKFRERAGGQWHWMFWDSDYAFGLMPDSYIEKDMFERVLEQEDARQQEAAQLLEKLLANPDFRNRFLVRLADLLNTIFLPQKVVEQVSALAAELEQDIVYELIRWPGTGDWDAGVEYMRAFARRRPDIVRAQAVEHFDLGGTAVLQLDPPPQSGGALRLNGDILLAAADLPWSGTYFTGTTLHLEALPAPGYTFAGWQGLPDGSQTSELSLTMTGDLRIAPLFRRAETAGPQPGDVHIVDFGRAGEAAPLDGVQGDWVRLQVRRPAGIDLRGWRLTDNDALAGRDEGSWILSDDPALAQVPAGTMLLLAEGLSPGAAASGQEGWIVAVPGGLLDGASDPWFRLARNDNLVLLAPGPTADFADDLAIAFAAVGRGEPGVTAADFGLRP